MPDDRTDPRFTFSRSADRYLIIDSIVPEAADKDRFINEIERLRDPSHVRSHILRQWLKFLEKTGLEAISVQLFERTYPFQEWAKRTGLDEDGIRALEEKLQQALSEIREKFKVQWDDEGKVDSYTDEKGIFLLKKVNSEA
ncbi:MAG: hypothetical protein RRA15_01190 [bacterium]|nr:hypothetical protein [bacterium]MDT8365092.1 hypothetical protein [bacterium]